MRVIAIMLVALCVSQQGLAANNNAAAATGDDVVSYEPQYQQAQDVAPVEGAATSNLQKLRINNEFWYIVLLSVLSIVSLTIVLFFLRHKSHSAKDIVNATGLTLIIFGTIILVLVVSTSEQLTAAIGILGAIAGYLFRSVQEQGGSETLDNNR